MLADNLLLLIGAMLVNNLVLTQLLGVSPLLRLSGRSGPVVGIALATTIALTLGAFGNALVEALLLRPLGLDYLRIVAFMLVIAAAVALTGLVLRALPAPLRGQPATWLPLITTHCALLGVALLNADTQRGLLASTLYGFGAGAGFALVLIPFVALRERLAAADVPLPFRGAAIGMVSAGLVALAFMGFAGLAR